jgi:hypothetical protein
MHLLGENKIYCMKHVTRCLTSARPDIDTYQGSKAKILDATKTPYVETRDTTIRAKIG